MSSVGYFIIIDFMTIILHVGKSNKMTAFIYYKDSGFLCVDSSCVLCSAMYNMDRIKNK